MPRILQFLVIPKDKLSAEIGQNSPKINFSLIWPSTYETKRPNELKRVSNTTTILNPKCHKSVLFCPQLQATISLKSVADRQKSAFHLYGFLTLESKGPSALERILSIGRALFDPRFPQIEVFSPFARL